MSKGIYTDKNGKKMKKFYLKKYLVTAIDLFMCYGIWCVLVKVFPREVAAYTQVNIFNVGIVYALVVTAIQIAYGLYDTLWKYINVNELIQLLTVSLFSNVIASVIVNIFFYRISIWFLLMQLLGVCMAMLVTRMGYYIFCKKRSSLPDMRLKKNMLIVGAGEACIMLLGEISFNNIYGYNPVGIIDDNPEKHGRKICGVKVLGGRDKISRAVIDNKVETIIFSIVNLEADAKQELLEICMNACSDVKVVHNFYDNYANESIAIRSIEMEELLGREVTDITKTEKLDYLSEKTVMVTGGGGSIGSELCRQISQCKPKKLIILDIYENNAYDIQQKLLSEPKLSTEICVEIASVRDYDKLNYLFEEYHPDIVFHAAAHKHVPLMETNPEEAIKNNVIGTLNMIKLSDKHKVEKFVLISTDKAVNPTNIMGATKRICEKIMLSFAQNSQTVYAAVRFGNVLGSNGSVVPLFKRQFEQGGPLTVTHPEVTRFFMTVSEAVSLVLVAGEISKGGEIFVLNMGKPVKIKELAETFIRLNGKIPYKDIDIKYIGLRPGEKLYEELLIDNAALKKTSHAKIFVEPFEHVDTEELLGDINRIYSYAAIPDKEQVVGYIEKMLPEFKHAIND